MPRLILVGRAHKVSVSFPLDASQTLMVLSMLPLAIRFPSGLNATLLKNSQFQLPNLLPGTSELDQTSHMRNWRKMIEDGLGQTNVRC
jgi:hypothetical protein